MMHSSSKKRPRVGSSSRLCTSSLPHPSPSPPGGFNDPSTSDLLLRLHLDSDSPSSPFLPSPPSGVTPDPLDLHLHSSVLRRSPFFSALLSDRWRPPKPVFDLKVPHSSLNPNRPFDTHVTVLRLLYTLDFSSALLSVPDALSVLHVAHSLLFDDCVRACLRFLEAVPWSDEEERLILRVAVPLLPPEDSAHLLARLVPPPDAPTPSAPDDENPSEEMLLGLIHSAINSHPTVASVKVFVAKLLSDFAPRASVQRVLDRVFLEILEMVKAPMAEYASPDFRVAVDNDETEAIQRLNLHKALVNTRKLLWLVERMIELQVADTAVTEWSNQDALALDLEKAFRDETCRNIAPALPALVMRCTSRLANAVAAGTMLASRQVRMKLVEDWLPVLNVCRDIVSPIPSGQKMLYQELEETFLKIISTLPMLDSSKLLQQCLSFSTRNIEDCPHLLYAFNTWFRRANQPLHDDV